MAHFAKWQDIVVAFKFILVRHLSVKAVVFIRSFSYPPFANAFKLLSKYKTEYCEHHKQTT